MPASRRLWWVVLCAAVAACLLFAPSSRSVVLGLLRGEAFFQGRPTSYWRADLKERADAAEQFQASLANTHLTLMSLDDLNESAWQRIVRHGQSLLADRNLDLGKDSRSLPVLLALLEDDDPDIRVQAAFCMHDMQPPAEAAVPRLTHLLEDKFPQVRRAALIVLIKIQPETSFSVPLLTRMLKDPADSVRARAASALSDFGPAAVPALLEALKDENAQVRVEAKAALVRIAPP